MLEREVVAVRAVRAAVHRQNERPRTRRIVAARLQHPAFDLGAVLARIENVIGRDRVDLAHERVVERGQLLLAASVERRHEQLFRMRAVAAEIRHRVPASRRGEVREMPLAAGDLLHRSGPAEAGRCG